MGGVAIFDLPHKKNKNAKLIYMTKDEKDLLLGILYPRKKLMVIKKHRKGHYVKNYRGFGINQQLFRKYRNLVDKFRFDVDIAGMEKATYLVSRKTVLFKGIPDALGDEETQIFIGLKYCKKVEYKGR